MIALAATEIIMGRHSNLGPIDPQIGGRPAIAIIAEFEKARNDIAANPAHALLWQPILQQYAPTLLSSADQAIKWTREIGAKTLQEGLFYGDAEADRKSAELIEFLISHDLHRAHGRHLHRSELSQHGLNITELEKDDELQDAVLSVHHACMITVGNTPAAKLIENHLGIAHVKAVGQFQMVQMPMQAIPPQTPIVPQQPPPPTPDVPQPETAPTQTDAAAPAKRQVRGVAPRKRATAPKRTAKRPVRGV